MFSPYHRFDHCLRLEKLIDNLKQAANIPDQILQGYNKYHYALVHKLKCARDYASKLHAALTDTPPEEIVNNSAEFLFNVNANIDGFFYTGGSALDILAREVLTYFDVPMPPRVYFHTAREELSDKRSGDPIIARLHDPPWKEDFSNYRNALTHEVLISGSYTINVAIDGTIERSSTLIPLPDDPHVDPAQRTYKKHKDVLDYCNTTFRRLLSLINRVYGNLSQRIEATGVLPL